MIEVVLRISFIELAANRCVEHLFRLLRRIHIDFDALIDLARERAIVGQPQGDQSIEFTRALGVDGVFISALLIANRSKARPSEMKFIRWRMRICILRLIDVRVYSHKGFISLTCWMLIFVVHKLVFVHSDQTSFLNAMLQPRWIDQRFLIFLCEEFCFDVAIFEDDVSGRGRLRLFNDVCAILSLQFVPETK